MKNKDLENIIEQLKNKGYDVDLIKSVSIGISTGCPVLVFDSEFQPVLNHIDIDVLSLNYWKRLKKEDFVGFDSYKWTITYSGEKSNRPPGENVLCKMSPAKRAEVLARYK